MKLTGDPMISERGGGLVFSCEISGQNEDGLNEYKEKNERNKYKKKPNTDLLQRKNNLKRFLPIPRRHQRSCHLYDLRRLFIGC